MTFLKKSGLSILNDVIKAGQHIDNIFKMFFISLPCHNMNPIVVIELHANIFFIHFLSSFPSPFPFVLHNHLTEPIDEAQLETQILILIRKIVLVNHN